MKKPVIELRLLVAVPCLNEAATILSLVEDIPRAIDGVGAVDVLVVDDGSTDETADQARAGGATVLSHGVNRGVGAAFQSAVSYAVTNRYDLMVNIDGDRQFNPLDIPKLVTTVLNGHSDMATASRFVDPDFTPNMPRVKLIGNHMMSYLISQLVQQRFKDVSCGFRCYSREALLNLNLHGAFTYTQETFLDFCAKNLRIVEVPVRVVYFPERKSRVAGSILKYAVSTAKIIFRGYRDYHPLRFFWSISACFFVPSLLLAALFFAHYLITGQFSGYLFAGFGSAFLMTMAIVFFVVGIVTDMLDRVRSNQDRILYLLKKSATAER
ncbi:glycosyltransferase family 2 protein [Uliginosibacterium aquaticum]|uniref:Glycosyltransferase family 2 protein n=1 Tax=Uliginosibacterium aquaticum TaxID=2731212 RepID=A0ABX2IFK7_9RHOO|nr:glycosyltransferase family 2 protein [Uliginosibacterium aquaticum]NSL53757.1 glycosyltransferase family 2 protein [Uliginosibacterium aquaticum]